MRIKKKNIDIIVILFQITYLLTLSKVITLDLIPINSTITLTCLMIFVYLYRFGTSFPIFKLIKKSLLLIIFFLIYFFDIFQCLWRDIPSAIIRLFACIDMFLFLSYTYNVIELKRKKTSSTVEVAIQEVCKPYIFFSLYNVLIVLLAAFLIGWGIINATNNEIPINSITKTNVESGQTYYFPYYISIVTESMRIFANLGIPMITGLSHEPHVLNYLIIPALFILLSIKKINKYKFYLYLIFAITLLFATSTTALVCFVSLFFIDIIWSLIINREIKNILPLIIFIFISLYFGSMIIELMKNEFIRKTVVDTGSMGYSENLLKYILSPNSILGNGNMPSEFGYKMSGNVGLITCILDVSMFLLYLYYSLKSVLSRNSTIHYLGLACLYTLLHSLKICIHIYNYPLFGLMLLINVLVYTNYHTRDRNNNKKHISINCIQRI